MRHMATHNAEADRVVSRSINPTLYYLKYVNSFCTPLIKNYSCSPIDYLFQDEWWVGNMSRMILFILCFVINEPPVDKNGQGDEYPDKLQLLLYPPSTHPPESVGVYWIHPVCPSVCPSVCLSVNLSCPPRSIYSSGWILSIFGWMINSMRGCVACDDPWPWPISSRSFGLDLENRVRSVASTVLDGFFYIWHKWSLSLEGVSRVTFF